MEIKSKNFILREWKLSDIPSVVQNANNIKVWNNVRDHFPYPYTAKDAEEYITMVLNASKPAVNFAIEINGQAVGGVGIVPQTDVERITAEIGYWLGERYWGKGIMTDVVKEISKYVFDNFDIIKLFAPVFDFNKASQKVLQKAGFKCEAILQKAAVKNGQIIDMHYYSLLKQ